MTRTAASGVRLRVGPWRGSNRIALVAPAPESPLPGSSIVQECCDRLAARGVERVVTGALNPEEQRPFLEAGFEERERLHLLVHDLVAIPHVACPAKLRRARRSDRPRVLEIDAAAFDDFWQLDEPGLLDAIEATPVARFRVGIVDDRIAGYAVCGRAGERGYVQRLAVDPAHRGIALGAALVADGLAWAHRHRCTEAMVNTQVGNARALDLYRSLGFALQPHGLLVLTRSLRASDRPA